MLTEKLAFADENPEGNKRESGGGTAPQLRLRIRDNGKGIDPNVLQAGARAGHYGLPGMRERAKVVGGKLAVWSELDSGTETELTIPAAIAYAKSTVARWSFFRRKSA